MMRGLGKKLKDVLTSEHEPREFFGSATAAGRVPFASRAEGPLCEMTGTGHEFTVGDDRCVFCKRRYDDIYPPLPGTSDNTMHVVGQSDEHAVLGRDDSDDRRFVVFYGNDHIDPTVVKVYPCSTCGWADDCGDCHT